MSFRVERSAPDASPGPRFVREAARFAAVGGAGVAVNLLVFNFLRHTTSLPVVGASVIATVVSIAFNYVGFRYFTYRDCDKRCATRELTLFLAFSALGLVIENGILYVAVHGFGVGTPWETNVFKFTGIAVATLFRFWSYRMWVFRVLQAPSPVPQGPPGGAAAGAPAAARHHTLAKARPPGRHTDATTRPAGASASRSVRRRRPLTAQPRDERP